MATSTDDLLAAITASVERLRPILDGPVSPSGLKIALWLYPDGKLREIEVTTAYKAKV
jgi:hypothetical protein